MNKRVIYNIAILVVLMLAVGAAVADNDHSNQGNTTVGQEQFVNTGDTIVTNSVDNNSQSYSGATAGASSSSGAMLSVEYPEVAGSAIAPNIFSASDCAIGGSGALQLAGVGISGGGMKESEECRIWEAVRILGALGFTERASKVACASIISHWAGFEYCANYNTPPRGWSAAELAAAKGAELPKDYSQFNK